MPDIEYFYSAHSAFAYLGARRLSEIATATQRRIIHRPIDLNLVLAPTHPNGFRDRSKAHLNYYFGREIERWAEYRKLAVKGGIPTNHRNDTTLANTMLIACATLGQDVDSLAFAVMQAHWNDHADLADRATLAAIITSVGLAPDMLFELAGTAKTKATYEANTAEAVERSVFGSPTYFVDGDMFYGQDHLELVERASSQPFARRWS